MTHFHSQSRMTASQAAAVLLLGTVLAMPSPLRADEKHPLARTETAGTRHTPQQQRMYRSSLVIRAPVRDLKGNTLGTIEDLVLGSRRGEIAYAVVSSGGVMGVGQRFHAVPWASLEPRGNGRYYVLNADRATLNAAPAFDLARWPDLADQGWRDEVDSYWARNVGHAVSAGNEPPPAPQVSGGGAGADD